MSVVRFDLGGALQVPSSVVDSVPPSDPPPFHPLPGPRSPPETFRASPEGYSGPRLPTPFQTTSSRVPVRERTRFRPLKASDHISPIERLLYRGSLRVAMRSGSPRKDFSAYSPNFEGFFMTFCDFSRFCSSFFLASFNNLNGTNRKRPCARRLSPLIARFFIIKSQRVGQAELRMREKTRNSHEKWDEIEARGRI